MAYLVVERGSQTGRRLRIDEFPITVGRDHMNNIPLQDTEISRFHSRIKKRGFLYILEDLGSLNGTFLNGDRVINAALKNGDRILVGQTELSFYATQLEPQLIKQPRMIEFNFELDDPSEDQHLNFKRLSSSQLGPRLIKDPSLSKIIYDHQGNLTAQPDFNSMAESLLKSLGLILTYPNRAAFFLWNPLTQELIPKTYRKLKASKNTLFNLNQKAFTEALERRQGLLIEGHAKQKKRLLLPMSNDKELIGLFHFEVDDSSKSFTDLSLDLAQSLLTRCAPAIESQVLKLHMEIQTLAMIETIIKTVEAKDTYTRGHSERVNRYSLAIADQLRLSLDTKRLLMMSALCHDIGKVGIPDLILKKASALTAEEYEEMKLHPKIGASILSQFPLARRFISGVKYHHEKWDGTGYPDGLVGEDIPFFGRIIALADAYDAMISGRAYSGFMGEAEAIERLSQDSELFDPEILKAFLKAYEHGTIKLKTSTQPKGFTDELTEIMDSEDLP